MSEDPNNNDMVEIQPIQDEPEPETEPIPDEENPQEPDEPLDDEEKPKPKKRMIKKTGGSTKKLPDIAPRASCYLRKLKMNKVLDFLKLENEFIEGAASTYGSYSSESLAAVDKLRPPPLQVATLEEIISPEWVIISTNRGMAEYYVPVLSIVSRDALQVGEKVLIHRRAMAVVGVYTDDEDASINDMKIGVIPDVTYEQLGGLEDQINEIREAVELPLKKPELFEEVGIEAPKGCLMYGPPGTGKTMMAKAIANATDAAFFRLSASSLISKFLGDSSKQVRALFEAARQCAPSIILLDEIDAIGEKRIEARSSGEREIQRTMLEILNQLDGFDTRGDVKVIIATNRIEALDPALIRPGRIDRKVYFPLPGPEARKEIFKIHTRNMTLAKDVNLNVFCNMKEELSGADIQAICSEAGMLALRRRAMQCTMDDFTKSRDRVLMRKSEKESEHLYS
ncbi:hypothetical protein PCE1_001632 [Barthelona sp. PCE]